jgi:hypothetical protein
VQAIPRAWINELPIQIGVRRYSLKTLDYGTTGADDPDWLDRSCLRPITATVTTAAIMPSAIHTPLLPPPPLSLSLSCGAMPVRGGALKRSRLVVFAFRKL